MTVGLRGVMAVVVMSMAAVVMMPMRAVAVRIVPVIVMAMCAIVMMTVCTVPVIVVRIVAVVVVAVVVVAMLVMTGVTMIIVAMRSVVIVSTMPMIPVAVVIVAVVIVAMRTVAVMPTMSVIVVTVHHRRGLMNLVGIRPRQPAIGRGTCTRPECSQNRQQHGGPDAQHFGMGRKQRHERAHIRRRCVQECLARRKERWSDQPVFAGEDQRIDRHEDRQRHNQHAHHIARAERPGLPQACMWLSRSHRVEQKGKAQPHIDRHDQAECDRNPTRDRGDRQARCRQRRPLRHRHVGTLCRIADTDHGYSDQYSHDHIDAQHGQEQPDFARADDEMCQRPLLVLTERRTRQRNSDRGEQKQASKHSAEMQRR